MKFTVVVNLLSPNRYFPPQRATLEGMSITTDAKRFPPTIDLHRQYLATGGHGFVGSRNDTLVGNNCDIHFFESAVKGVDTVLRVAIIAGDHGQVRGGDDLIAYQTNACTMTSNVASIRANVRVVAFASTTPLHPGHRACSDALEEKDAWTGGPPRPQRRYDLERLISELLAQRSANKNISAQIARLSNVFGPRDAWNNGQEKLPLILLRKALAIRLAGSSSAELETRGNGQQQSLLFISDCVDAILALLASGYGDVVHIWCDRIVTVGDLADAVVRSVGLQLGSDVVFRPETNSDADLPTMVRMSSSGNHLAQKVLRGWTPQVPLEEGMALTGKWLRSEMEKSVNGMEEDERYSALQSMRRSKVVTVTDEDITFAVLLPITSRGSNPPSECLSHLKTFTESLARTTWRDTHQLDGQRFVVKVYLAIDHDDTFLSGKDIDIAEAVSVPQNIHNIAIRICRHSIGHTGTIWRQIAKQAWADGFEYFVLMTNDVVLKDEGWLRDAHEEFMQIADRTGTPHGFGCVAFTDNSHPGVPTFPVIHRTHLSIFGGHITPEILINQGGVPFLHQLYRRWDCYSKLTARISGASQPTLGDQEDGNGWTFGPLDRAVAKAEKWLSWRCPAVSRKLTLDIVIPSFRVQLCFLEPMLNLKAAPTCNTMFIVIIDDPHSPARTELETRFASRPDVRIRVNDKNLGASASRNRGMKESAAEWIMFLDDDVTPQLDILVETEKVIRANPDAVGFVGNAKFPPADLVFTTAAHLSGVTFFWDIAEKMPKETDVPWGVTANLIARRNNDGVEFNLQFPKTGGGEDIDFCRKKRDLWFPKKQQGFLPAPKVLVTHPWWNGGKRSYHRFYMWSKGDGGLIKLYPELCYVDHAPCSGELLLISCILICIGVPFFLLTGSGFLFVLALHLVVATVVAHVLYDMYRHLYRDAGRTKAINSTLTGPKWLLAIAESSLIRIFNECGRVVGLLERGEIDCLGWRFDWFTGRWGDGPRNEDRMNSRQKFMLVIVLLATLLRTVSY